MCTISMSCISHLVGEKLGIPVEFVMFSFCNSLKVTTSETDKMDKDVVIYRIMCKQTRVAHWSVIELA